MKKRFVLVAIVTKDSFGIASRTQIAPWLLLVGGLIGWLIGTPK